MRFAGPLNGGTAGAITARRTVTVVAMLTMLCMIVLLTVVALSGRAMNRAAERMEERFVTREIDRAVARVLDEQKSVALWDEAVVRIRAGNQKWLDSEIGAYLNGSYGHNHVYIVDGDDKLVYAFPRKGGTIQADFGRVSSSVSRLMYEVRTGKRARGMRVRDQGFTAIHDIPAEMEGASALRWSAHLLNLNGRPVIASAMTVVPTTTADVNSAHAPLIISLVRLDDAKLAALGLGAAIRDLHLSRVGPSGGLVSVPFDADDGVRIGALQWTPHHPGHRQLTFILPLLGIGAIWVVYATLALLRRLIILSRGLEKSEREAVRLSYYDSLCDLPNRRKFIQSLHEKIGDWLKGDGTRPLVAYIDLDRFKDINDTLGHDTGDELVRSVGERLMAALSGGGHVLARLGGDEFAVMTTTADPLAGWKLGRQLCAAFVDPVQAGDHIVAIAASIGIAIPSSTQADAAELMREADIALYRAKEAGRGRAVIFRPEMGEAVERRRQTELNLRAAIAKGQLHVVYQPVLTIEGAPQFNSVEALLRWEHPERGLISPDEFIPIAETSGQMAALGDWVLSQALKDGARWPGLQIAVNLSPVQLKADGFVRRVSRMVADAHARPSQIIFEVTENVMMDASGQAGQALKDLRALGFRIALDDFGTGYSSLSYLRRFQFDRLKIDRSFIEGVEEDSEAMAVIEMVVVLGRKLGLEIVAEGIENETQARLMKAVGCTHLQGWFVARPLECSDVTKMLDTSPRVEPIVQVLRGSAA